MDLKEQYDKLLRYCYAKTKDRFISEDIVQETFLKFWQSGSYRDAGKEQAYLYTIARNLCMDEFRRRKLLDIDSCDGFEDALQFAGESLDDAMRQKELNRALDALPDELRETVILRYANELKVKDIAKILGISRFAVYRREKEGLSVLRSMMEGDEKND